jgi:CDP-2,3-bis-(O-geranylgeranyl)-sn-glycerol synthase
MQPVNVIDALILLTLANGAPVLAAKLMGPRLSYPVDGNVRCGDGKRLFGRSKTMRGVATAVLAAGPGAMVLGLGWKLGAIAGSPAMAGDLFSSFIKRRLGMASSSMALGLDQIPESMFPLLACSGWLPLGIADITVGIAVFFIGELVFSRLFFALGLRDQPY